MSRLFFSATNPAYEEDKYASSQIRRYLNRQVKGLDLPRDRQPLGSVSNAVVENMQDNVDKLKEILSKKLTILNSITEDIKSDLVNPLSEISNNGDFIRAFNQCVRLFKNRQLDQLAKQRLLDIFVQINPQLEEIFGEYDYIFQYHFDWFKTKGSKLEDVFSGTIPIDFNPFSKTSKSSEIESIDFQRQYLLRLLTDYAIYKTAYESVNSPSPFFIDNSNIQVSYNEIIKNFDSLEQEIIKNVAQLKKESRIKRIPGATELRTFRKKTEVEEKLEDLFSNPEYDDDENSALVEGVDDEATETLTKDLSDLYNLLDSSFEELKQFKNKEKAQDYVDGLNELKDKLDNISNEIGTKNYNESINELNIMFDEIDSFNKIIKLINEDETRVKPQFEPEPEPEQPITGNESKGNTSVSQEAKADLKIPARDLDDISQNLQALAIELGKQREIPLTKEDRKRILTQYTGDDNSQWKLNWVNPIYEINNELGDDKLNIPEVISSKIESLKNTSSPKDYKEIINKMETLINNIKKNIQEVEQGKIEQGQLGSGRYNFGNRFGLFLGYDD